MDDMHNEQIIRRSGPSIERVNRQWDKEIGLAHRLNAKLSAQREDENGRV